MNPERCLSENSHDQSISSVNPGKLHVVRQLIRRNSFQNKLAGVSKLAFISFQRDRQKADPHRHDKQKDQTKENPGPPSVLR